MGGKEGAETPKGGAWNPRNFLFTTPPPAAAPAAAAAASGCPSETEPKVADK